MQTVQGFLLNKYIESKNKTEGQISSVPPPSPPFKINRNNCRKNMNSYETYFTEAVKNFSETQKVAFGSCVSDESNFVLSTCYK